MPQMTPKEQKLNDFLVGVFNDILRLEEANLLQSCGNLSVTELHVLDAVARCGPLCGMADIAAALKVTAGTATVAVKTLEQKGYLVRTRHKTDKRRVTVSLTGAAQAVLAHHEAFHAGLVRAVAQGLPVDELDALGSALARLHHYFNTL